MSAYLVPEKQISVLSKWYIANTNPSDRHCYNLLTSENITPKNSEDLAQVLATANIDSVNARYSDVMVIDPISDKKYIKDCMKGAEIRSIGGGIFRHDPDMDMEAASIWNLCENLDYQSCEVNDWVERDAYWLICMIKDRAAILGMRTREAKMTWGWVDAA